MDIPSEIVEEIAAGYGTVFVGAGLSCGAGLPAWAELIQQFAKKLDCGLDNISYIDIAQYYANEFTSHNLIVELREILEDFKLKPTSVHESLVAIPFTRIFTTNYDDLIEKALKDAGREFNLAIKEEDVSFLNHNKSCALVKLHGDLRDANSIVITAEDYEQYFITRPSLTRLLALSLQTRSVLFLGYSVSDPDFRQILNQVRHESGRFSRPAYIVQFNAPKVIVKDLVRRGFQVINLDDPTQTDNTEIVIRRRRNQALTLWLQELNRRVKLSVKQHNSQPLPIEMKSSVSQISEEVAFWLEARGYYIEQGFGTDKHPQDMVVQLSEGIRLLVRCVDGEIGIRQVVELDDACTNKNISTGWIICNERISPAAAAYTDLQNTIKIFNMRDFMLDVFGRYFENLKRQVEETGIAQFYVDLSCAKPVFDKQGVVVSPENYDQHSVIDKYIDSWLSGSDASHLCILGEFGQGKTWFCRNYAYRKLQHYLEDPTHRRIPFLIALRDCRSFDIRQLVTDLLVNQYQIKGGNYQLFDKLNRTGRLLLILDGFDEMTPEVNDRVTVANFEMLAEMAVPGSKLLLTCRTSYFRDMMDERRILTAELSSEPIERPEFDILYLKEFENEQIEKLLRKRVPDHWKDYRQKICEVFDLANLAQRPFMLDLIITTLPNLESHESIKHADLYQKFSEQWISKDIKEERALLDPESKRFFSQEVAWEMFKTGVLTIHADRMMALVALYLEPKFNKASKASDVRFLEHDIRNSSFISRRDERGNYEFMHRSFMEFFVAQKLAQSVRKGDKKPFEEQTIYYEIIRFLNQLLDTGRDIPTLMEWWDAPQSNETLRATCTRLSGQWIDASVLNKLMSVARNRSELTALRRDAIRSIIRILHGEEADWPTQQVKVILKAFAIRTSRETLEVQPLLIDVKLLHSTAILDERSRLMNLYCDKVAQLLAECLSAEESLEIQINASYAMIHFIHEAISPLLLTIVRSDADDHIRFNCFTALLSINGLDDTLEQLLDSFNDPELRELAEFNLKAIRSVIN
jgi:hypothetical protein